jgi:hypothetical protein
MKKLHELAAAMTLLVLLSTSALAGEISTNVVSPPLPQATSATATAPGEIGTGAVETDTFLTEITLSFLQLLAVI